MELLFRPIAQRANQVMDLPGASGVFCVSHDCDLNDCRDKHTEDD